MRPLDDTDRAIVNALQGGLPVCERPFAAVAARLGVEEPALRERLERLLADGVLTRFGPMFDVERMGGAFTLCAMQVPAGEFDRVATLVNAHPEVAHNYEREHVLNMWFVLATGDPARVGATIEAIEAETGLPVLDLPKLEEFHVGLRLEA